MNLNYYEIGMKAYSLICESIYGIDTRGIVPSISATAHHYETLPYHVVFQVLRKLRLTESDVFYDIGCGKGRILCCAARLTLRSVVGVELNETLAACAMKNVEGMRGRNSSVSIQRCDARTLRYADATAFFLYNPFPIDVVNHFLQILCENNALRSFKIAYVNPIDDVRNLEVFRFFEVYDEIRYPNLSGVNKVWFVKLNGSKNLAC